jgi:toxin-antitoxin system PIN domain toxin
MTLIDANRLLYAYDPRAARHAATRKWLEHTLSGFGLVRFTWLTLWAFLRISTNPRVYEHPMSIAEAEQHVSAWLAQPSCGILEPGERHWELGRVDPRGQTTGPLVTDAVLASIAIEHGATLHTTDRDFARFAGLRWIDLLTA